jgi:hypothetical protein
MDDQIADTQMNNDVFTIINAALTDVETQLKRSGHQIFWDKETTLSGRVQVVVWQDDNGDA